MNVIYMYCKIFIFKKIIMERGKDYFKKILWWKREKDCLNFFGIMIYFFKCESRNDNMRFFIFLKFKME